MKQLVRKLSFKWVTCNLCPSKHNFSQGRWSSNNESLCAAELRLRLKSSMRLAGLKPGTASSAGHRLTC